MLTEFQKKKLTHFFRILDFNGNDRITYDDFEAIAENLCVLWGFREGDEDYNGVMKRCEQSWDAFISFAENSEVKHANLEEWIKFADKYIVNCDLEVYKSYVPKMVNEIVDYFDANNDGYISLDEYIDMFMAFRIEVRYSAKAFTRLDKNGDNILNRKELLVAVAQFFRSKNEADAGNWLFGYWDA